MRRFVPISAASLAIVAFLFLVPSRAAAEAITLNQGFVTLDGEGPLAFGFGSSDFGVQQLPLGAIDGPALVSISAARRLAVASLDSSLISPTTPLGPSLSDTAMPSFMAASSATCSSPATGISHHLERGCRPRGPNSSTSALHSDSAEQWWAGRPTATSSSTPT
jgi:hypothetical protein